MKFLARKRRLPFMILAGAAMSSMSLFFLSVQQVAAQTCAVPTPPTTYGQVKQSVTVTSAGIYRVWSRIKASNTANNSYYLQVDNGCAINVGDAASIPANTWTWVNYKDGTTSGVIELSLTAGTHQLAYTGKEADVQLDRVLLLGDSACTPTGTGDNCVNVDVTNPTVSITAPTANTSVTQGTPVAITATASDNVGVTKVEILVDGVINATDTASLYSYAWNTTGVTVGAHSVTARAYDAAGNTATSVAVSVTVTAPPVVNVTVPFRMNAGGPAITDDLGQAWAADAYFTGGSTVDRGASIAIAGTTNDSLYQYERYGVSSYSIPIANGTYTYRLHFAETTGSGCAAVGCRIQTITVESAPFLTNFDIFRTAGAVNTAVIQEGTVTIADGTFSLGFSASVNMSEINGIEILPAGSTGGTPPPVTGDTNGDGRVNGTDYGVLAAHFGENYSQADFDKDGLVTAADLAILLAKWTW